MPQSAPQITIRDALAEWLDGIRIVDNYNTDVEKVFVGKVVAPDKFPGVSVLVQLRIVSNGPSTDGDAELNTASFVNWDVVFEVMMSMSNTTEERFICFVNDVVARLAQCPLIHLGENAQVRGMALGTASINHSSDQDQLEEDASPVIRRQSADMPVIVEYSFVPELLSGTP